MIRRLTHALLILIAAAFVPRSVWAATDVALRVDAGISENELTVQAENSGGRSAENLALAIELNGQQIRPQIPASLAPGKRFTVQITMPHQSAPGSYPVVLELRYRNGETPGALSVRSVLVYNEQRPSLLSVPCGLPKLTLGIQSFDLPAVSAPVSQRLILPAHIRQVAAKPRGATVEYFLENSRADLLSQSDYFLVVERTEPAGHSTAICRSLITTRPTAVRSGGSAVGYGAAAALAFAVLAWLVASGSLTAASEGSALVNARWLFSIGIVAALLTILHGFSPVFSGPNYDYFRAYGELPLFYYMVLGNHTVLKYLIRPQPGSDKYWHLLCSILSNTPGLRKKFRQPGSSFDGKRAWLAIRTIAVKAFYVPLLTSWLINDIFHQYNLTSHFRFSFAQCAAYLIALCIFVDVLVFTAGYLTELPQLRNEIKSVDASILGWVVCLMCYPPFTQLSIGLLDIPLNESWKPADGLLSTAATTAIAALWCLYTWATLALGFRASNLTNRGIVDRGPYRFVRHPAYVAKLSVWILSSFALGTMNFYLILTLIIVYGLRAFTEEQHLRADPEYVSYAQRVKWRAIPGLF